MSVRTPSLSLAGVRFGYGATPILDGVDLDLAPGEFVVLAGAGAEDDLEHSVAGLVGWAPDEGDEVRVDGDGHRLR